eukprot:g30915.t1
MARELNNMYFVSVFMVEDTSNIQELRESQGTEVSVVAITKEKVLGKLRSLKVGKSPGPGGLHPRVLKEIGEEIVKERCARFICVPEEVYKNSPGMKGLAYEEKLRTL